MQGVQIAGAQDAERAGQRANPAHDVGALAFLPMRQHDPPRKRRLVHVAGMPGGGQDTDKGLAPQTNPSHFAEGEKGELTQAAVQQVLGRHATDGIVVATDVDAVGLAIMQFHQRHAGRPHGLGQGIRSAPGDDAVAPPARKPPRRRIFQIALFKLDRPCPMLANVLRDPFDEAAAVTAGGFNQQSDMRDATIASHSHRRKIKIV